MSDSHNSTENQELPSYDDINTPVVVMVGVISAILTLLAVMFVQGLFYHWEGTLSSRPVIHSVLNDPKESQKEVLTSGPVSIDQAIEKVVSNFKK
jgi:hypothetical protein